MRRSFASMQGTLVFVYGTLKRGMYNYSSVLANRTRGHSELVAENVISVLRLPMLVLSRFNVPFLFWKQGIGNFITGEIYRVDDSMLEALDKLEGHPHYYTRSPIDVRVTVDVDGNSVDEVVSVQAWLLPDTHFDPALLEANETNFQPSYTDKHAEVYIPPSARPFGAQEEMKRILKCQPDLPIPPEAATEPRLDWSQFALIVVDVQKDFWSERLEQDFPNFKSNIASVLRFARNTHRTTSDGEASKALSVIHVRETFREDGADWLAPYKVSGRSICIQGTPGAGALPEANACIAVPGFAGDGDGGSSDDAKEIIINKHAWDGFCNPELATYLRRRGKKFVMVCGLVTSVCVLQTASSAVNNGFLAAVLSDCCADHKYIHEPILERYSSFAFEVVTAEQLKTQHAKWTENIAALDSFSKSPATTTAGL